MQQDRFVHIKCISDNQAVNCCLSQKCLQKNAFICPNTKCKCNIAHKKCQRGSIESAYQTISKKLQQSTRITSLVNEAIKKEIIKLNDLRQSFASMMEQNYKFINLSEIQIQFYKFIENQGRPDIFTGQKLCSLWKQIDTQINIDKGLYQYIEEKLEFNDILENNIHQIIAKMNQMFKKSQLHKKQQSSERLQLLKTQTQLKQKQQLRRQKQFKQLRRQKEFKRQQLLTKQLGQIKCQYLIQSSIASIQSNKASIQSKRASMMGQNNSSKYRQDDNQLQTIHNQSDLKNSLSQQGGFTFSTFEQSTNKELHFNQIDQLTSISIIHYNQHNQKQNDYSVHEFLQNFNDVQNKRFKTYKDSINKQLIKNSSIIDTIDKYNKLANFFPNKIQDINLIFKASEHNFSMQKYYQTCGLQTNTIIVCLNQYGKIIGGYTPLHFEPETKQQKCKMVEDASTSFVFSLTSNQKFPVKNKQNAISRQKAKQSINFGWGYFFISSNLNRAGLFFNNSNYDSHNYKNDKDSNSNVIGSQNYRFVIKQWEVLKVNFLK